jgi:hypothetical protein
MATPTTEFRALLNSLTVIQMDTASERKAQAASGTLVDAEANPWDFGTVSIAGASAPVRSAVKHLCWHITAWGGNTAASNFRGWFNTTGWGFDNAGTTQKYVALKYEAGANGDTYVVDADEDDYGGHATWDVFAVQAGAPAQNLYAGDGATSFGVADTDIVGFQSLLEVDELETSGTYTALTSSYEYMLSHRYDFS